MAAEKIYILCVLSVVEAECKMKLLLMAEGSTGYKQWTVLSRPARMRSEALFVIGLLPLII